MQKLNVCLLNDSFPPAIDGVANAVTNYGKIINGELGRASVITPYYPDAHDEQFDYPVLRYPSIDLTKAVGYRAGIPFSAEVMHAVEESGFDIIHTHCPITSTMLARAFRERIDAPIVFTYHTKFDIDIANAVRGKLVQEEAARLLVENINACDEVWTVSRGAGENLHKLGYKGDYIVMPNGVDFSKGRVDEEKIAEATKEYDLPNDVPVFLFVGRMMWYKGIKIILDALRIIYGKGLDFRMVFIGGGNDKDEIVEYSEKLGLGGKVIFSPPIRDRELIRAWYCRGDMFLFPSTFDTNGLVVREAAACALGSVLVAGSCAAEDVTDGINGLLIEENGESMAAMLERLCADRALMKRIGENAQRDIYMSWEDSVKNAYQRYGIVIDNYKSGLYAAHENISDDFFKAVADTMAAYYRSKERQQRLREESMELTQELLTGIKEERQKIADELEENRNRIKDGLSAHREKLEQGIEYGRTKMQETVDDFYQFMDRFM